MNIHTFTGGCRRPAILRYGIALSLIAIAAIVRILFLHDLGTSLPYTTLYPAVAIAAIFGGIGPGLFATLLSTLVASFFWIEPIGALSVANATDELGLLVFVLNSAIVSFVSEALLRAGVRANETDTALKIARERQQADESLRQSKNCLDRMAEQTRAMIWEVDAEGRYKYISNMSEAITGYRLEDIVGCRHFYDLHPDSGREDFKSKAFDMFRRKESFRNLKNPIQTKDGRIIWVSTDGVPVLNADGTLAGYWGIDTDITGREQSEKELIKSEERLHAALEHIGEGVMIATEAGEIIYLNPAARRMHGFQGAQEGRGPLEALLSTFQL